MPAHRTLSGLRLEVYAPPLFSLNFQFFIYEGHPVHGIALIHPIKFEFESLASRLESLPNVTAIATHDVHRVTESTHHPYVRIPVTLAGIQSVWEEALAATETVTAALMQGDEVVP